MPIFLRVIDRWRHRRQGQKQEEYVKNIVHECVNRILAVNPTRDPHPLDGINMDRYNCLNKMMLELRVALKDYSSFLSPEKRRDIGSFYTNTATAASVEYIWSHYGCRDREFYEKEVFDKLREIKWLELDG